MKTKLFGFVMLLMMFGAMPSQAATLIDDGNTTYDPNTGLRWLDVSLSTNISYDQMLANLSDTSSVFYGYRFATGDEVRTLFTDASIPQPCSTCSSVQVLNLMLMLGTTYEIDTVFGSYVETYAWIADGYNSTEQWFAQLYHGRPPSCSLPFSCDTAMAHRDHRLTTYSNVSLGSFLVGSGEFSSSAAPLPATLPLFATGLGALGLLGWRRKKKAQAIAA